MTNIFHHWMAEMKKIFSVFLMLFLLQACDHKNAKNAEENTKNHDHNSHNHDGIEATSLDKNPLIPSIKLDIKKDRSSGWNIFIDTKNFTFQPEKIDQQATSNEGHAHIYVDNFKMARVYSHWYHLKDLQPGTHTVRVTLNANNHATWQHNGQAISAEATIHQP